MISPRYIDYFQLEEIISGKEKPKEGLYYSHHKEEEDSGWIDYHSYRYYRDGDKHPVWILDISGEEAFISILYGNSLQKMVDKENFLDYVTQVSPDVRDWVLFNLDAVKFIR
jgi:hypothetical protein